MKRRVFGLREIVTLAVALALAVPVEMFTGWSIVHYHNHLFSQALAVRWWRENGLMTVSLGLFGGLFGGIGGRFLQKYGPAPWKVVA